MPLRQVNTYICKLILSPLLPVAAEPIYGISCLTNLPKRPSRLQYREDLNSGGTIIGGATQPQTIIGGATQPQITLTHLKLFPPNRLYCAIILA